VSIQGPSRFEEGLLRGFIWAYVGGVFGAVFLGLLRIIELLDLPLLPEVPAAAAAGAVSALFYGSMRLAVLAAMAGTVASFGFLALMTTAVAPVVMAFTSGFAGLLLGAFYGRFVRSSRVFRADAKTLAGLLAGVFGALVLLGIGSVFGQLPLWATTAILCPTIGLIYILIAPWFVRHFHNLLPPVGDGALVGAGVAAFVGLAVWVMVGQINPQVTGPYAEMARHILDRLPEAAAGAMAGAALAGFLGGLAGRKWQDL